MEEQKYTIGYQTFSLIIKEGRTYVDKTQFIQKLLNRGKFIFLSRPRRFGKSLLVTTLKSFFEGQHELFKDLAIDRDETDWTPSPVLHFDFNTGLYSSEDGLRIRIDASLSVYEEKYGIITADRSLDTLSARFENLIRAAFNQTGRQVVVLIDEYDKPLLGLERYEDIFLKNQQTLKAFYGNLKSMEEYIRFGFITGVARFSKVSIFSDLNHLQDISLEDRFADICGITEEELIHTFRPGIEALALKRKETFEVTLDVLRNYYDGYLFTEAGSRLYNPYSVMLALESQKILPYWFGTGTPTFLVELIRAQKINPEGINGAKSSPEELLEVNLKSHNPIPLMFQTGYLTIDTYDERRQRYTLRFPNREVEKAFAMELLPLYVKDVKNSDNEFSWFNFQDDLYDGEPERFMKRLETLFKDLPSEDQCEAVYRAVTYLLCKIMSIDPHAERHSYKGRSDMEVLMPDYIYIFEFKYNRSVSEAMDQIHSRDYAGRYALDPRPVYLLGVNIDTAKATRSITYEIRLLPK